MIHRLNGSVQDPGACPGNPDAPTGTADLRVRRVAHHAVHITPARRREEFVMSRTTVSSLDTTNTGSRARAMRLALLAAAGLVATLAVSRSADAQTSRAFELRPFAGAMLFTGDQKDILENAALVGLQGGYRFHPNFSVVGTFGWSPSKDKTLAAQEKLDLWQYDVGVEGRLSSLTPTRAISTQPYATLGVGGRTYDYRDLSGADAQTNVLGYGAVGVDLAQTAGPLGLRIEVRDNVSAFKGLRGELDESKARNDVQLTAGMTVRF
jgi:hypothetical protein